MSRSPRTRAAPTWHNHPLDWLTLDGPGADVLGTARRLLAAETILREALPPALGAACRACRIDGTRLTLAVPTASHAAKLRQLGPRAAASLRARGWDIEDVRISVQADAGTALPAAGRTPGPGLDAGALQAFETLGAHLPDGPLAQAVARLLRHHRS